MKAKESMFLVQQSPHGGYEARALPHAVGTEADERPALMGLHLTGDGVSAV